MTSTLCRGRKEGKKERKGKETGKKRRKKSKTLFELPVANMAVSVNQEDCFLIFSVHSNSLLEITTNNFL